MFPEKPSLEALPGLVKAGFTEKRMSERIVKRRASIKIYAVMKYLTPNSA